MENQRVCCFCSQNDAKYLCPRCHVSYCSKTCYQSQAHVHCSEEFFKECVENELKLEDASDAQKKHMLEILKRFESEENDDLDSDDDDSIPDLSERLKGVDLDDADEVWNCLNEQEKQEFRAILQSGDVGRLVPQYEPWWSKRYENKIQELESINDGHKEYESICPTIDEIVPFSTLTKAEPSSYIIWNIANVMAAYVFTVRRFNGDHHNEGSGSTIFRISTNLNSNQNFEDILTAVDSVIYHANNHVDITCTSEEASMLREDVEKIFAGPEDNAISYYVLSALSDLKTLFTKIAEAKKGSKKKISKEFAGPPVTVPKLKLQNVVRKLVFYLSWIDCYYKSKICLIP